MALYYAMRTRKVAVPTVASGLSRAGKRTKELSKLLQPGEIAIIDHNDLDTVAAHGLVAAGPIAVLNAAASSSGRYPNEGPSILLDAGILLVDNLGPEILNIPDGSTVEVDGDQVWIETPNGKERIPGIHQTVESIAESHSIARESLSIEIEAFAENTMRYLQKERDLLLDGVGVPEIHTDFTGREALVVVRGHHYKEDLAMLRPYIKDARPIIIGVDGGADAILDAGLKLDLIVGDMDSVSDRALTSGAEVVVHAYRDGRAPGAERVRELGVEPVIFPATGTSEDIAMLLADEKGAKLIVGVGTHTTLVEYLDKGRAGMASTFLTRLRVGTKLVDAKGVSMLYRSRISNRQLGALSLAGIGALVAALWATDTGQAVMRIAGAYLDGPIDWLMRLFGG